jgi:alpha-N-acetylglucosaminidase
MGNIQRSWDVPITLDWIAAQADLQVAILARMRAFGMSPVLPGFAGHVPSAMASRFPNASFSRSPSWRGFETAFSEDSFLAPSDPLFHEVGQRFYSLVAQRWGLPNDTSVPVYFAADAFNEMLPASTDAAYLAAANAAIHAAMSAVRPSAVLVMQGFVSVPFSQSPLSLIVRHFCNSDTTTRHGKLSPPITTSITHHYQRPPITTTTTTTIRWLFVNGKKFWKPDRAEAFLSGVPDDRMLVLDLWSENEVEADRLGGNYYGKPWVWSQLQIFGGRRGMFGSLAVTATSPVSHLNAANSTMAGIGATPEVRCGDGGDGDDEVVHVRGRVVSGGGRW